MCTRPELGAICVCIRTCSKATKLFSCVCLNYKSVFSAAARVRAVIRACLVSECCGHGPSSGEEQRAVCRSEEKVRFS